MQIVIEKIRADKKLLIAETMELAESEGKAFWPVYDSYQKILKNLSDRMIKIIGAYTKNYETMSNEVAKRLLDEYLAIERERLKGNGSGET